MKTIYEPSGRAREFSPLALNLYENCDHACLYCYSPIIKRRYNPGAEIMTVRPRPEIIEALKKDAPKFRGMPRQVLLCFSCDPYCHLEEEKGITRQALEILLENRIPVSILTKGGRRCLRDLDLFRQFGDYIQVGATLTCLEGEGRKLWEPGAAPTQERIDTLRELKAAGIRTFVSFEPVIYPNQTLMLARMVKDVADHFKVGKLNYQDKLPLAVPQVDWGIFLANFLEFCRGEGKPVYVKESLWPFAKELFQEETFLRPEETDPDLPVFQAATFPREEGQCSIDF